MQGVVPSVPHGKTYSREAIRRLICNLVTAIHNPKPQSVLGGDLLPGSRPPDGSAESAEDAAVEWCEALGDRRAAVMLEHHWVAAGEGTVGAVTERQRTLIPSRSGSTSVGGCSRMAGES